MASLLRTFALALIPITFAASTLVAACNTAKQDESPPDPPLPGQTVFESDDPDPYNDAGTTGSADAASSSDTGAASDGAFTPEPGSKDEAARAIAEADIIQVRGTRLYALSRTGGLSVIDIGTRDSLKLLGRFRTSAEPFEMYVQGDVVLAMYNGYSFWEWSSDGYSGNYQQSSRILALDVKDPGKIATIGEYAIPGEISDSRMVGDVLYAVSYESGYCWHCQTKPNTTVLSLNVKDPRAIVKADQVTFSSPDPSYSWWRRSVTATTNRLYVAGIDWAWDGKSKPHSTIQVLDISDAGGKLGMGASVPVEGQVTSRWQMDERDGVLRVISQVGSGFWSTGDSPMVQTFKIASSTSFTKLGEMPIKLPKPETLMSVRFDGTRAYAITTERKDPLFTIDLTDPAKPVQMGEIEMPGWVFYMEPRGDRMLGLGFDQANPDGAMTVSLFDVSNLATPKMIKRVNFGKGWASAPEDSDRIHKAFRVLDDQKLILVPFSSYDWRSSDGVCHSAQSGIQLIDWKDDTLTLRGMAPVLGQPRRAFLYDERMFAVSDGQVATFDIADRDKPAPKTDLALSNPSHKSVPMGDYVVQLSEQWWTQHAQLTINAKSTVGDGVPVGSLDLSSMMTDAGCTYWGGWWSAQMFVNGSYLYVVVPNGGSYGYGPYGYKTTTLVGVVDVRDPKKPQLVGKTSLVDSVWGGYYGGYYGYYYGSGAMLSAGDTVAQVGSTLAVLRTTTDYSSSTRVSRSTISLLDLSDPTNPRIGGTLNLPGSSIYTPLQLVNGSLYTSHYEPTGTGRVRFFVDAIDVSAPSTPRVTRSINVPGSLLASAGNRLVTVDYRRTAHPATDWTSCATAHPDDLVWFDYEGKECRAVHRILRLVRVDSSFAYLEQSGELPKGRIEGLSLGEGRVFIRTGNGGYYDGKSVPTAALVVLSGFGEGSMTLSSPLVIGNGYGGPLYSKGAFALTQTDGRGISVIDATDPKSPKIGKTVELAGRWITDVSMTADAAYCSLGEYGILPVPLR